MRKLFLLALVLLTACAKPQHVQEETSSKKIVSLSAQITQTLVALELGDDIIAVDDYSVGIEGIKKDIPAFDLMSPDVEKLLSLKPDLILATSMSIVAGNNPLKPVSDAGIKVEFVPVAESIEDIVRDLEMISDLTGTTEKAKTILNEFERNIQEFKNIAENIKDKKTVYFEISALPALYSFGKGVYLDEMIETIGATNIFNSQEGWLSITEEAVVKLNPDVIITNNGFIDEPVNEILSRKGWENITAIKNKDVYLIDKNTSSQSNHLIINAMKEMAAAVYPEYYTK